jgi:5'-deoxynucleotidase YfbR-like HD superfamily hydrolase
MILTDFCPAWPDNVKEARQKAQKAFTYAKCLENALEECTPSEFESLWEQYQKAREEAENSVVQFDMILYQYNALDLLERHS